MTVECNWTLPAEITQRVTTFLPLDDLVRFSKCCRFFFQAACEPNAEYWRAMVQRRGIELLPSETNKGAVKRFFGETMSFLNGINDYSSDIKDDNFKRKLRTCMKIDRLWPRLRTVFDFLKTQKAELILDTVVVKATKGGNTAAARFFLEEIGGVEACKDSIVIESGNLPLVQLFHSYNLLKLDESLFIAVREGYFEIVDFLMEHSSFTPETLKMAKKWAAVGGNLEIYELLSKDDKTPEAAQGLELLIAVENGDFERVREIFEKQPPDIYYRNLALIWAAGEGDEPLLQYLFTVDFELDYSYYDMALWASSLRGRSKTFIAMRLLLADDNVLKDAVLCAIKNKCLSVVVVATEGFLNLKIFQSWVIAACERGYLPIVEELVWDEDLDSPTYSKALEVAAREGHLPVIQFLLRFPPADGGLFVLPILAAAANGHLECIKALVQTGRWDFLIKSFAIEIAQMGHYGDVVQWLKEQQLS